MLNKGEKTTIVDITKIVLGVVIDYFRAEKPLRTWLRKRRLAKQGGGNGEKG